MFESTLEAQGLHGSERRVGTLSAVAAFHALLALALVGATLVWIPVPEGPAPQAVIWIPPRIDLDVVRDPGPVVNHNAGGGGRPIKRATPPPPITVVPLPPVETPAPPSDVPTTTGDAIDPTGDGTGGKGSGNDTGRGDGDGPSTGPGLESDGPLFPTPEMTRPVLLSKVEPAYPSTARIARLNGRVVLQAVIGLDGAVESVEILSSTSPLFDDAARDAVRRWRYRPATMDGRPVRIYFTVQVDFVVH